MCLHKQFVVQVILCTTEDSCGHGAESQVCLVKVSVRQLTASFNSVPKNPNMLGCVGNRLQLISACCLRCLVPLIGQQTTTAGAHRKQFGLPLSSWQLFPIVFCLLFWLLVMLFACPCLVASNVSNKLATNGGTHYGQMKRSNLFANNTVINNDHHWDKQDLARYAPMEMIRSSKQLGVVPCGCLQQHKLRSSADNGNIADDEGSCGCVFITGLCLSH